MGEWKGVITSDPTVMLGKPVVKGTRITVELVLEKLSAGETFDDLQEAYPALTQESMRAAIAYALDVMKMDVVYPVNEVAN